MWRRGAILLAAVALRAQYAKPPEREVEIEIQDRAAYRDRFVQMDRRTTFERLPCSAPFSLGAIAKCRDGAPIKRIVMESYDSLRHSTPDDAKRILRRLLSTEVDRPLTMILWAEPTFSTLHCRVEMENGKMARLETHCRITTAEAEKRRKSKRPPASGVPKP